MNHALKFFLVVLFIVVRSAAGAQSLSYKCMIQMDGFPGDGAYIVVSLMDDKNKYVKTLYMLGADKKWQADLKEWHLFRKQNTDNIDAVTGASVSGGDRAMITLTLDKKMINAGYKIRFESAVEDNPYHAKDAEVPLTTEALAAKTDGTGYIKYVRFSSN